jgi:hypothetical protein
VERRHGAIRPQGELRAVVRGIDHDGVLRDLEVVQLLEQFAELARRIALRLQHIRDGGHPIRNAVWVTGHADGQLPGDVSFLKVMNIR